MLSNLIKFTVYIVSSVTAHISEGMRMKKAGIKCSSFEVRAFLHIYDLVLKICTRYLKVIISDIRIKYYLPFLSEKYFPENTGNKFKPLFLY